MDVYLVTGSTRGIGLGLAQQLLRKGKAVVINGRRPEAVLKALKSIREAQPNAKVEGFACDVTRFDQVQGMWDFAVEKFSKVDVWINNAGVMNPHEATWDQSPQDLKTIVDINLLGSMYGCKVAVSGMTKQGFGHVYNFEGFGSNGKQFHPYMTPYGATKSGIRYFTRSLAKELKQSPVNVGAIAPGIVVTDLLRDPYKDKPEEWAKAKKIFNILGDRVETVTGFLADELIKGRKNGKNIEWLTFGKVLGRFIKALFTKRDLFSDDQTETSLKRVAAQS